MPGSRVVLCGSMSSLAHMRAIADQLAAHGLEAVLPEPDELPAADRPAVLAAKAAASRAHFDAVRDPRTCAVLLVNVDRAGRRSYVGPNAFAEAAVAFAHGRPAFLLQGMPPEYDDELTAWGATCLFGDLAPLLAHAGRPPTCAVPALSLAVV